MTTKLNFILSDNNTNSVCRYCNDRFNATFEDLLICSECGEVCHQNCYVTTKKDKCHNETQIHESKIKEYSMQKYIDVQTLKRTNYVPSFTDYMRALIFRTPYLLFHFGLLYLDYIYGNFTGKYSKCRYKIFLNAISYGLNINFTIIGKEKLESDKNNKIIYVTNHVSFHDVFTIPRFINAGAISSVSTLRHIITQILSKYTNVLFVKRGDNNKEKSIVDQLNDFVRDNGSVVVCPQGLLGKYNTISKFRTTAFRTKYKLRPIVLKYDQDISSIDPLKMLLYPKINGEIHIMDITEIAKNETPEQYAERIRIEMANKCGLLLSNVNSRDIKD